MRILPQGATYLLNDPHKSMLLGLCQLLYPLNDLLVVLALYGNGDSETAHDEGSIDIIVLGDGLKVWDLQSTCRLV